MEAPTTVPGNTQCQHLGLSPSLTPVDHGGADAGGKLYVFKFIIKD